MTAAPKEPDVSQHPEVEVREVHRSGEHVIGLDAMIRRSFESAFEADLQTTSRLSRFDVEDVLSSPDVRPSTPGAELSRAVLSRRDGEDDRRRGGGGDGRSGRPIVEVTGIALASLPPPAIEVHRTKEEERDRR